MADESTKSPSSTQISSLLATCNLPLNEEEQSIITAQPELRKGVELLSGLLQHMTKPITPFNCQIIAAEGNEFHRYWKSYRHDHAFRKFCGGYMARRGAAALIRNYLIECAMSTRISGMSTLLPDWAEQWWVREVHSFFRQHIVCWAHSSDSFRLAVCESGYISDMLSEIYRLVQHVKRTGIVSLYEGSKFIDAILSVYNCSKYPQFSGFFKEDEDMSALHHVRHSNSDNVRWLVLTTMCNVARDDSPTHYTIADAPTIHWAVTSLKAGALSNETLVNLGNVLYTKIELVQGFESITRKQKNRHLCLICGIVPVVTLLLHDAEENVQEYACRTVTNLCQIEFPNQEAELAKAKDILREIRKFRTAGDALMEAAREALEAIGPRTHTTHKARIVKEPIE